MKANPGGFQSQIDKKNEAIKDEEKLQKTIFHVCKYIYNCFTGKRKFRKDVFEGDAKNTFRYIWFFYQEVIRATRKGRMVFFNGEYLENRYIMGAGAEFFDASAFIDTEMVKETLKKIINYQEKI